MDTPPLARLRQQLGRHKVDALLVTQPENRRFLSNYSATDHGIGESCGVLLIHRREKPLLLTDSRFHLQAQEEALGFQVELYPKGLHKLLQRLLPKLGIKRLGFESHYLLHRTYQRLAGMTAGLGVELVPFTDLIEQIRLCKSEDQIALLRKSVLLNELVFQEIHATINPGVSEIELALEIEATMRRLGAERPSFDTIVAFGENAAKPHAIPSTRRLREGELVLIDMGLVLGGYCSDMTRTFVMGTPPDDTFRERQRVVRRAMLAGIAAIRAGVTCREVDLAARRIIAEAGYGDRFGHALGHGVGLAVHEEPRLGSRSRKKLRSGMVVTVEPGIYLPDWGGIRLENMVVVRDEGCEVLNRDLTGLDL